MFIGKNNRGKQVCLLSFTSHHMSGKETTRCAVMMDVQTRLVGEKEVWTSHHTEPVVKKRCKFFSHSE